MKEVYERAKLEVIAFQTEDVILTSGGRWVPEQGEDDLPFIPY